MVGDWLGRFIGYWLGGESAPSTPGFADAGLICEGQGRCELAADTIGQPQTQPVTGGNWTPAFIPPRRRRPVEEDEALLLAGAL